jgi:hypothetical protein
MAYPIEMNKTRLGVLISTLVAWGAPTALAMWLDVERIVHPHPLHPAHYDYEWDPKFQRVFFWFRFGWMLLVVIAVVMATQAWLLRKLVQAAAASRTASTSHSAGDT